VTYKATDYMLPEPAKLQGASYYRKRLYTSYQQTVDSFSPRPEKSYGNFAVIGRVLRAVLMPRSLRIENSSYRPPSSE